MVGQTESDNISVHDTVLLNDDTVAQVEEIYRDHHKNVYMVLVKPTVPSSSVRRKVVLHEIKVVL